MNVRNVLKEILNVPRSISVSYFKHKVLPQSFALNSSIYKSLPDYFHLLPRIVTSIQVGKSDHVFSHNAQFLSGVIQLVPAHV